MEDIEKKAEEVLKKLDEVIKGLEEAQQGTGEESEEESEEEFDFDAIDAELADIIDRMKGHKDPQHNHAYIIGFKRGNGLELGITGDGATLKAMFCVLRDQKPFCGWSVIEAVFERKDGNTLYQIRCKSCKCGTGWFTYWGAAVDAWNRRPGDNDENAKGSMPGLSG